MEAQGVKEIVVTPEMIDAGVDELMSQDFEIHQWSEMEQLQQAVRDVFEAMMKARLKSHPLGRGIHE